MVTGFSFSRKEGVEFQALLRELQEQFRTVHQSLRSAIQKDSDSYAAFGSALKMPKGTDEEKKRRQEQMQRALEGATLAPIAVAEQAAALLQLLNQLKPISNPNLISDLQTGVAMAHAAIRGALANVAINLKSIKDEAFSTEMKERVASVEKIVASCPLQ
jgi:formiminotetrahydrofolate cyclodeaminase